MLLGGRGGRGGHRGNDAEEKRRKNEVFFSFPPPTRLERVSSGFSFAFSFFVPTCFRSALFDLHLRCLQSVLSREKRGKECVKASS